MIGTCDLCGDNGIELTKSDIIPKWFWKEEIKHNRVGNYYDVLNDRYSDKYIYDQNLCKKCNNETFSRWEQDAKSFYLSTKNPQLYSIPYSSSLHKFSASMSWRILVYSRLRNLYPTLQQSCKIAESRLNKYLNTNDPHHLGNCFQHIFLFSPQHLSVKRTLRYGVHSINPQNAKIEVQKLYELTKMINDGSVPNEVLDNLKKATIIVPSIIKPCIFTAVSFSSMLLIGVVESQNTAKNYESRIKVLGGSVEKRNCLSWDIICFLLQQGFESFMMASKINQDAIRTFYQEFIMDFAKLLSNQIAKSK